MDSGACYQRDIRTATQGGREQSMGSRAGGGCACRAPPWCKSSMIGPCLPRAAPVRNAKTRAAIHSPSSFNPPETSDVRRHAHAVRLYRRPFSAPVAQYYNSNLMERETPPPRFSLASHPPRPSDLRNGAPLGCVLCQVSNSAETPVLRPSMAPAAAFRNSKLLDALIHP
ncbi:hypothetical protein DENSPDRAFT_432625 [Dentipellis sp. KUC8613]|nr:hypothetical protein DENSPDRAFT_432625 [Dentipellis sp. KUC8613]